jgi:hypothetical protein
LTLLFVVSALKAVFAAQRESRFCPACGFISAPGGAWMAALKVYAPRTWQPRVVKSCWTLDEVCFICTIQQNDSFFFEISSARSRPGQRFSSRQKTKENNIL